MPTASAWTWRYPDGFDGPLSTAEGFSECYPCATPVGAAELGYQTERPRYKRKPTDIFDTSGVAHNIQSARQT
jgi:hypothetical protein